MSPLVTHVEALLQGSKPEVKIGAMSAILRKCCDNDTPRPQRINQLIYYGFRASDVHRYLVAAEMAADLELPPVRLTLVPRSKK